MAVAFAEVTFEALLSGTGWKTARAGSLIALVLGHCWLLMLRLFSHDLQQSCSTAHLSPYWRQYSARCHLKHLAVPDLAALNIRRMYCRVCCPAELPPQPVFPSTRSPLKSSPRHQFQPEYLKQLLLSDRTFWTLASRNV